MRTIVEIPEAQLQGIAALCRREKISRAEAVRRAVARLLTEEKPEAGGLAAAFGLWKGRRLDARRHVERLREEWA